MPPTPLHFLAIAPLHFKRPETFDVTALLCSSTFVDLELLYLLLTGRPMIHGFWHSYFYVLTIYPVALSLMVYVAERRFDKTILSVYRFFRFFPKKVRYSVKTIYFCCLIGGVSHIFFDMWVHENSSYVLFPFYEGNPFWIGEWSIIVFSLVVLLSLYTVFLWIRQLTARTETGEP
ncbi:MAG: DUF4184 family protein [Candidatus Bathyarchaeota archaeon]|nr:DUF4184 family protein [Candidatus Bathyarchaeota archaeon]MDH5747181.1 DUF4184 family protein [Candidatus Bathyarchaeota archaeon]